MHVHTYREKFFPLLWQQKSIFSLFSELEGGLTDDWAQPLARSLALPFFEARSEGTIELLEERAVERGVALAAVVVATAAPTHGLGVRLDRMGVFLASFLGFLYIFWKYFSFSHKKFLNFIFGVILV